MWNILVYNRFKLYAITADIQKVFLQIRIQEFDRDTLCFHWVKKRGINQIDILKFTRLVSEFTQSLFVLDATLVEHISKYRDVHKQHTNCSIESRDNHDESIEHQLTNKITTKSQESQSQAFDSMLKKSGNIIPNINREISYPGDTTFA